MIFPEIRSRLKALFPDSGELLSLNLKSAEGVTFGTTELDFLRKYPSILQALGAGSPSWSGESVSLETALQHSVVWACYCLVCESVSRIPANLMIKTGDGKKEAVGHPMYRAMRDEPNPEISAQGFREMLTGHCLFEGDAFAKIVRRSGTGVALELHPLQAGRVVVDRERGGRKRLVYSLLNELGAKDGTYTVDSGKPHDILHLRGITWNGQKGLRMLSFAKQSIGVALAAERNVGRFWALGGRVPYLLEMANRFATDEDFKKFRADWTQAMSDPHHPPILENGTVYKQTGLSMVDSQALETRQWTVSELCRWAGVSPHLAADLSRATFSNIEQLFLEFKTLTLSKWAHRWEQDWNRCVLTPEEKEKNYFLHHNLDALLRGDFKSRMEGYATALQNGHMNIDEVRGLEDRNALPDGAGQPYHIQMNMGTVPGTGEPMPSELRRQQAAAPKQEAPPAPAEKAIVPSANGTSRKSTEAGQVRSVVDKILTALRN